MDVNTTIEQLAIDNMGATGEAWMDISIKADLIGRTDLVRFARDMAEKAYEIEAV